MTSCAALRVVIIYINNTFSFGLMWHTNINNSLEQFRANKTATDHYSYFVNINARNSIKLRLAQTR